MDLGPSKEDLSVSIGICAYNEENNIGPLLKNLLWDQGLPEDSEIIVICSGCDDRTPDIVSKYAQMDGRVKLILENERRGKANALNHLLRVYRGKIFVHLDADHLPEPGAIKRLISHFDDDEIGAVSGHQIPVESDSFMGKISKVIWSLHNETQRYYHIKGKAQHLGGVLFAIRRGICDKIPEDIVNDDAYMGVVCRLKNYKIVYDEKAKTIFKGPETISDYLNQRRRVVYGHLKVRSVTGVSPMVLEESPLRDKIEIISRWIRKHWNLLHYFLAAVFLEFIVNILARFDFITGRNNHKIWKIARSTKMQIHLDKDS